MLMSESLKIQNSPILIDKDKIINILDNAIENNPSLIVGKTSDINDEPELVPVVDNSEDTAETNCLALTVKKDYNLSIARNAFFKGIRMSIKVAISTFFLNVARIFL